MLASPKNVTVSYQHHCSCTYWVNYLTVFSQTLPHMSYTVTVGYFHLYNFLSKCIVKPFMAAIVKPERRRLLSQDVIHVPGLHDLKAWYLIWRCLKYRIKTVCIESDCTLCFVIKGLIASLDLYPCKHRQPWRSPAPLVSCTVHWQRPTRMQHYWLTNARATIGSPYSKPK